jgi:hypothetical protein
MEGRHKVGVDIMIFNEQILLGLAAVISSLSALVWSIRRRT